MRTAGRRSQAGGRIGAGALTGGAFRQILLRGKSQYAANGLRGCLHRKYRANVAMWEPA